jgi:hypothetical protein
MKKNSLLVLTGLVFAAACAAQTIVPPPDCAAQLQQAKAAGKPATAAAVGCPGVFTGAGTPGVIPVFTSPNTLGDSVIAQTASGAIGIGGAPVNSAKLFVSGTIDASGSIHATGNLLTNGFLSVPGINLQDGKIGIAGNMSAAQYNIGPERVLGTTGTSNVFGGIGAGKLNTGSFNSFFGFNAGFGNAGSNNAVFGDHAAVSNGIGSNNAFFGSSSGQFNVAGSGNAYFGADAGVSGNGNENSFFGFNAGKDFFGGNNVTLIGAGTVASAGIHNATAVGNKAIAMDSDTLILGASDNFNGGTSVKVGIGTPHPQTKLDVASGDVYISGPGSGLILRTTGGGLSCAKLNVSPSGQISATLMNCPGSSGF